VAKGFQIRRDLRAGDVAQTGQCTHPFELSIVAKDWIDDRDYRYNMSWWGSTTIIDETWKLLRDRDAFRREAADMQHREIYDKIVIQM
jgi:hypothetical protein